MVSATGQDTSCADCSGDNNKCSDLTKQCKDGSIKSCYLAAACLCRCNLDAGGCGSEKDALQECVDKNEKAARDME